MTRVSQSYRASHWLLPAALVLSFVFLPGCGNDRPPTYPVSGRVIFSDGSPVRTGFIELQSDEHSLNARGTIARDGSFRLTTFEPNDGAVAGSHRAVIVQFLAQENLPAIPHDHGKPVSLKHADYGTSGLTFEVDPSQRNITWEVVVEELND